MCCIFPLIFRPPKKYKIVRHGANLGNPGGNFGHNNQHHDIIDSVHHEDVNFPKIPPPQYSGKDKKHNSNSHVILFDTSKNFLQPVSKVSLRNNFQ